MGTELKKKHRKNEKYFTRERKLTFTNTLVFILRKSVKSLQNSLNEFFDKLDNNLTKITTSAFCQARQKLSYKVFIELNQDCVIDEFYAEDEEYKKYKGFRLLAIDGSKINLPDSSDIKSEFGTIRNKNQIKELKEYCAAQVSVMHDVLNDIIVDSKITKVTEDERQLAIKHLDYCMKNDLIIGDRGYPSYELLAKMQQKGVNFVFRCSTMSFKEAQKMFSEVRSSKVVTLKKTKKSKKLKLPEKIQVRFVKIILDTGETEVLVTSLLDEKKYTTDEFKELYWKRWGIETLFDILKNRLNIENFTGKSVEAVKQDFYSTIFISNYESIMTANADEILLERSLNNKNRLKTNKAVSFNTIKNNIIDLIFSDNDEIEKQIKKVTELFLQSPTAIRRKRSFDRTTSSRKSLNYHKRRKKICF